MIGQSCVMVGDVARLQSVDKKRKERNAARLDMNEKKKICLFGVIFNPFFLHSLPFDSRMTYCDYSWLRERGCTDEQIAFYEERKRAKSGGGGKHGINPRRPFMCHCARNFGRRFDLVTHRQKCRMRGMTKNYNTLKDTHGVWVKAMGGYWKLAWAIALRFIARLITRRKERIAYAPGGTKMIECVRMWSHMAASSSV